MRRSDIRTSDLLIESCWDDCIPDNQLVIKDYFGIQNTENMIIIFGIYQGLIKYKGVTSDELHNALKAQKINELIHSKYKFIKSKYYDEFSIKKIIVGTFQESLKDDSYIIKDDNHCPNCGKNEYITKNYPNDAAPDCEKCFKFVCKRCSHLNESGDGRICFKCY